jgi:hypothetical protein
LLLPSGVLDVFSMSNSPTSYSLFPIVPQFQLSLLCTLRWGKERQQVFVVSPVSGQLKENDRQAGHTLCLTCANSSWLDPGFLHS